MAGFSSAMFKRDDDDGASAKDEGTFKKHLTLKGKFSGWNLYFLNRKGFGSVGHRIWKIGLTRIFAD